MEENDTDMFNPTVLEKLPISQIDGLLVRPLKSIDFDKGIISVCIYSYFILT